jgi:hypothetical protein
MKCGLALRNPPTEAHARLFRAGINIHNERTSGRARFLLGAGGDESVPAPCRGWGGSGARN